MATIAETLGANLRRIRKAKGVSRKQLAEILGIVEDSVGSYETGKKLAPLDKIFVIADFLDVSITDLTGENKKAVDKKVFEYRFERAKKMLVYLDSFASLKDDEALHINDQGNISIYSPEKIVYEDGMITTYGKGQSITFKNVEIFVDVMERAEHRALYQQIPFNQALNELVNEMTVESKKE